MNETEKIEKLELHIQRQLKEIAELKENLDASHGLEDMIQQMEERNEALREVKYCCHIFKLLRIYFHSTGA